MRFTLSCAIGLTLVLHGPGSAGPWDTDVLAGAAKVSITPPLNGDGIPEYLDGSPVWMAGFSTDRAATSVHDELYARALVLEIDGRRIAFLSMDLVGLFHDDVLRIRQLLAAELEIEHLIVASTHNHEGPDTIGLWGYTDNQWPFLHPGVNDLYMLVLKRQAVQAVKDAVDALVPAGLRAATTSTDDLDLIRDSRDPIIIDEQLTGLQAVALDGGVIGTMVNWSNHPEVLWDDNTALTADYPGFVCDHLEDRFGGTAVFLSGALGGLLTPNVDEHTFEEADRFGAAVAGRIAGVLEVETNLVLDTSLDIRVNDQVEIFFFNPMMRLLNHLWRRSFRTLYNCVPFGVFCQDVRTEVNLVTIDGVAQFISVPGEIVPELAFELLAQLDAPHRFVLGLANDEIGYILPEYRYECDDDEPRECWPTNTPDYAWPPNPFDPGDHYEETVSLGPRAAPVIMEAVEALIDEYNSER